MGGSFCRQTAFIDHKDVSMSLALQKKVIVMATSHPLSKQETDTDAQLKEQT